MRKRIDCKVTGLVQGVFFRNFVQSQSQNLGLTGFVSNEDDGSVRVVAEGDENKLKTFLKKIKEGTSYARVEDVQSKWQESTKEFPDFSIRF